MQIPVVVERVIGNGFRARSADPVALSASGPTRDDALAKLRAKIQTRLKKGAELVNLDLDAPTNPWLEFAGMFKDDPYFDDWQKAIAKHRQELDNDPNSP